MSKLIININEECVVNKIEEYECKDGMKIEDVIKEFLINEREYEIEDVELYERMVKSGEWNGCEWRKESDVKMVCEGDVWIEIFELIK